MTNASAGNGFRRLAAGTTVAAVVAAAGCGGAADSVPNPDLKIPVSTATEADAKAGRGGGMKMPGKK